MKFDEKFLFDHMTIFLKFGANLYRQICGLSDPDDARKSVQIFMLYLELQTTHFSSDFLEILEKGICLVLDHYKRFDIVPSIKSKVVGPSDFSLSLLVLLLLSSPIRI